MPKHTQYPTDLNDGDFDGDLDGDFTDGFDAGPEFDGHPGSAFPDADSDPDDLDPYDSYSRYADDESDGGGHRGGGGGRPQRMRRRVDEDEAMPARKGRMTLEERGRLAISRENADMAPPEGDRWTNWGDAGHGPEPRPEWVVTGSHACDHELGVLKTGKEADVFLLRRVDLDTGRDVVMAAKRYRSNEHRTFHRDAGYLEGRRLRRTRDMRAIENRTSFGMNLISQQWAIAEFQMLTAMWEAGVPVPYPVQIYGTELLIEYLDEPDGSAAPRLAQLRPEPDELLELWEQLVSALLTMARMGLSHGDLSPYNLLVHRGRLTVIDLPQTVDVVVNPNGREFLARDVRNVSQWFTMRGLPEHVADPEALIEMLSYEARLI